MKNFSDIDSWYYEPRVIQRKRNTIVEAFYSMVTKVNAYDLYIT